MGPELVSRNGLLSPRTGTQRIAVWGHFHGRNLGDELVVEVLLGAIRARVAGCELSAISIDPIDASKRHGVPAAPINPNVSRPRAHEATPAATAPSISRSRLRDGPGARIARTIRTGLARALREPGFLVRSYSLLRNVDTLVVAGSGQLLDAWRGPWEHPYTTFRWALLARLAHTEVLYVSVGAGPIESRLSGFMIRSALEWASYISVRDASSAEMLRSIGVRRELPLRPDMGWAYPVDPAEVAGPPGDIRVVGINVMSHADPRYWPNADALLYRSYLEKMATVVTRLIGDSFRVLVFSSHASSDRMVADDLVRLLSDLGVSEHECLELPVYAIDTVDDLVRTIARCDYVLAARFHSVLLPLTLGIPTLGLAYHPKTRELLAQVRRPSRCFDIDTFEVDEVIAATHTVVAEGDEAERRELRQSAERLRALVEEQFDALFGPRALLEGDRATDAARPS